MAKTKKRDDTHLHKCPICGRVWEHEDTCGGDFDAHHCPEPDCDGHTWQKHYPVRWPKARVFRSCEAPPIPAAP